MASATSRAAENTCERQNPAVVRRSCAGAAQLGCAHLVPRHEAAHLLADGCQALLCCCCSLAQLLQPLLGPLQLLLQPSHASPLLLPASLGGLPACRALLKLLLELRRALLVLPQLLLQLGRSSRAAAQAAVHGAAQLSDAVVLGLQAGGTTTASAARLTQAAVCQGASRLLLARPS
jgi:hypothetical protein